MASLTFTKSTGLVDERFSRSIKDRYRFIRGSLSYQIRSYYQFDICTSVPWPIRTSLAATALFRRLSHDDGQD